MLTVYRFELLRELWRSESKGVFEARDSFDGSVLLLCQWTPVSAELSDSKSRFLAITDSLTNVEAFSSGSALYLAGQQEALSVVLETLQSQGLFSGEWPSIQHQKPRSTLPDTRNVEDQLDPLRSSTDVTIFRQNTASSNKRNIVIAAAVMPVLLLLLVFYSRAPGIGDTKPTNSEQSDAPQQVQNDSTGREALLPERRGPVEAPWQNKSSRVEGVSEHPARDGNDASPSSREQTSARTPLEVQQITEVADLVDADRPPDRPNVSDSSPPPADKGVSIPSPATRESSVPPPANAPEAVTTPLLPVARPDSKASPEASVISPPVPDRMPYKGPPSGRIVWRGNVREATQVTLEMDRSDIGRVQEGALPGVACDIEIIEPREPGRVSIRISPGEGNAYRKLVMVVHRSIDRVVLAWSVKR